MMAVQSGTEDNYQETRASIIRRHFGKLIENIPFALQLNGRILLRDGKFWQPMTVFPDLSSLLWEENTCIHFEMQQKTALVLRGL